MSPPSRQPTLPPIYPHPDANTTLLPHLIAHLPCSLPLLRRLTHHTSSPHSTALATFPPSFIPAETQASSFTACWYDRARAPETECWLFSTYEVPPSSPDSKAIATTRRQDARAQLLALMLAIAEASALRGQGQRMVVGSVHTCLLPLLAGEEAWAETTGGVVATEVGGGEELEEGPSVLASVSRPYAKWVIPPSPLPSQTGHVALPAGYEFSTLKRKELARVVASTCIPRTEKTLAELGNVCVRDAGGRLVSWGFLGVDGSLSSLYTEEGFRGMGLAKAVARALFERLAGGGGEGLTMGFRSLGNGKGWVHSDIAIENKESAAVARAIGGKVGWECRWVSVDLRRMRMMTELAVRDGGMS